MGKNELTVNSLIELLRGFPAEMPIVIDSYEDGVDPVTDAVQVNIADYPNRHSYYGIYRTIKGSSGTPALRIFSSRRGEEIN